MKVINCSPTDASHNLNSLQNLWLIDKLMLSSFSIKYKTDKYGKSKDFTASK